MKQTPLKRSKRLKIVSEKTAIRNAKWKQICMDRALYLTEKYGFIICEYSGEVITTLSSVPNDTEEGWGHHLDGVRAHCVPENCYIVKYKYHSFIHDNNLTVKQEGFEGKQNAVE